VINTAIQTEPQFGSRWIGMLNRELKRLRLQCERLALPKLQNRVLHLIETEGTDGQYALLAGAKSLARELGVTHEALYRCLANMEDKKMIVRKNKMLCLVV
jgi:CRP-like cAMP-binding protein